MDGETLTSGESKRVLVSILCVIILNSKTDS